MGTRPRILSDVRNALADMPIAPRFAIIGAVGLGAVGAVAGLVLGLIAYVPTAWFAVAELGVPAAMLGAILGLVIGSTVSAARRIRQRFAR